MDAVLNGAAQSGSLWASLGPTPLEAGLPDFFGQGSGRGTQWEGGFPPLQVHNSKMLVKK